MSEPVRSLYFTNTEVLNSIKALHCPAGFECDLTYGNGAFWKEIPEPKLLFDIQPLREGVIAASSTELPLPDGSLGNCVFDPPFLTYVRKGRGHNAKVAMTSRFGGYYRYDELEAHYAATIAESYRVLRRGGVLVFKCQDIIHNHKMHCTHNLVINWAVDAGFRLLDLYILGAKSRMPGPQKGTQRHARIWHSYFLVFKKEGKGK